MHSVLRNISGLSKLSLLVLLIISGAVGATLSYLWTTAYYIEAGFSIPEGVTTITITNVTFPVKNSTYFDLTVLNPSYSKSDANITSIAIINQANDWRTIRGDSIEPAIPYPLTKGDSVTFKCHANWAEFAGQIVRVVVFLEDDSGATFPFTTASVALSIADFSIDTKVTIKRFNITIENNLHSVIPVNITEILLDTISIPIENITTHSDNSSLPHQILPGENETFTCEWNLLGLLGSHHNITAKTIEGYSAVRTVLTNDPVSLTISEAIFAVPHTDRFNLTVLNSPSSPHYANISKVIVANSSQILGDVEFEVEGNLTPGNGQNVKCLWDWEEFKNKDIIISVFTTQGFFTFRELTIVEYFGTPIAFFEYSPSSPYTDEVVSFNASKSYDTYGVIVRYFWDFGDSNNGTGETITHAYIENGTYTVALTVTDSDGLTDLVTTNVTILNSPPMASFTMDPVVDVLINETVTFNASSSYDPDGNIVEYQWDFGDGSNATGMIVQHSYSTNGTFIVILTVTDDDRAWTQVNSTKTVTPGSPLLLLSNPMRASYHGSEQKVNQSNLLAASASPSRIAGSFPECWHCKAKR